MVETKIHHKSKKGFIIKQHNAAKGANIRNADNTDFLFKLLKSNFLQRNN
jgi:hypothetical protein